jgi:DNA-binding IclR family transcriptional regulator
MLQMRLLKSLLRGLRALDFIADQLNPVRLTDIAVSLKINKSNASNLLRTLVESGYVTQTEGRRYIATDKLFRCKQGEHSLEEIIAYRNQWRPCLQEFVDKSGECAHMGVLVGSQVWYIDKIDSTLPLKVDHPIGTLAPLYCTALGKAFLSFGSAGLPRSTERFTDKTITDQTKLEDEIASTRLRKFAIDREEYSLGIMCVAAPVYDDSGSMIAAIGISGPTARISRDRLAKLGEMVRNYSQNWKDWSSK